MARRKMCGQLGCINIVDGGVAYCPEHERQRGWPRRTGGTRSTTAAHRARRERILRRDRYQCQLQYPAICVGNATIVDHIRALGLGGADADENCEAACAPCHRQKTSREGHLARGHRIPGGGEA